MNILEVVDLLIPQLDVLALHYAISDVENIALTIFDQL
jgi:hypothetical protein